MPALLSQRRYQVLGTAWIAWFVNYLDRTKTAALLPLIIASLSMTKQETGRVLFWFFLGYAAVQPLAGFASSWTPTGTLFAPYLAEILTPGAVGRSLGVVVLGGMLGSAVAQPLVAHLIVDTPAGPDFSRAFLMFAFCGVVLFLCCAGLIEPRVRRTYLGYLLSGGREGTWRPASQATAAS